MDGVMRALGKKKTTWKEDLFLAVKLARHKLSKYNSEVTPLTSLLLISAHILAHFRKLGSFRKWDKAMNINPGDKTSDTTQCQETFLKYDENEYCAKDRRVLANKHESSTGNNLTPSKTVLGSCQSFFDPYDLSGDNEEYVTPNNVAEMTPGRSDSAARLLTAPRLYLN